MGGSCKWMSEATPPLFGNLAVHRMDGDYVGEPGRVSKRARPGGLPLERDDGYCLQDNYNLPASFFVPYSNRGAWQRQSQGFAVTLTRDAFFSGRGGVDRVWHC